MVNLLFKILGVIGVLLITYGIYIKNEIKQDWIFVLGGLCLLAYSIYLRDPIFIPLQIIFTTASGYEIYRIKSKQRSVNRNH
ncbi:MAG: YgjV family protein [Candidatus Magasanikbacteria bacterium]|nr:YgjV family protein [Candidatus Magasanikbacteria bacterium]